MELLKTYICAFICMTLTSNAYAQNYAVSFPPVRADVTDGLCELYIIANAPSGVTILQPSGATVEVTLAEGELYTYSVPCEDRTTGGVENKVYYVTVSGDARLMASNSDSSSHMDATLIYPRNDFNKAFYLLSYVNPSGESNLCGELATNTAGFYVISAFDDNTEIQIRAPPNYDIISTLTMNRFQSFTNRTTLDNIKEDFSGLYITSSKPVSVSTGGACTHCTSGVQYRSGVTWAYVPPTWALGDGVHVTYRTDTSATDAYVVLVLATQDNTNVTIAGTSTILNRGEKTSRELLNALEAVQCSLPCLGIQVSKNTNDGSGIFMNYLTPLSAFYTDARFPAPRSPAGFATTVRIVVSSNRVEDLVLEGLTGSPTWVCKDLAGTTGCQAQATMSGPQGRIYSSTNATTFSAVAYASMNNGRGFGVNLGYTGEVLPLPDEPLGYHISQNGPFRSSTGEDFTIDCTLAYTSSMSSKASDMLSVINAAIGFQMCFGKTTDQIRVGSIPASLTTSSSTGVVLHTLQLEIGDFSLTLEAIDACAVEIGTFAASHDNWDEPILPDEPGCPGVVFESRLFNTTSSTWECPEEDQNEHGGRSVGLNGRAATPAIWFGLKLDGFLETITGEDLPAQCTQSYSQELQTSTTNQVGKTNSEISVLCPGQEQEILIVSATVIFASSGSQAFSFQDFFLLPESTAVVENVLSCASAISTYLRNHDNWAAPILPTVPDCPELKFSPAEFLDGGQYWACQSPVIRA